MSWSIKPNLSPHSSFSSRRNREENTPDPSQHPTSSRVRSEHSTPSDLRNQKNGHKLQEISVSLANSIEYHPYRALYASKEIQDLLHDYYIRRGFYPSTEELTGGFRGKAGEKEGNLSENQTPIHNTAVLGEANDKMTDITQTTTSMYTFSNDHAHTNINEISSLSTHAKQLRQKIPLSIPSE